MPRFMSDEEGSMETIYRSRGSLWWGLAALVGWLFLLSPRLGWLMDLVPPPYYGAADLIYSYSILGSMLGIVLCVIQLLRDRPVLRAGDRGVWFRLSLRRRGTIPWRRISGISLAPDGTTVLLHLYGGSASEETPLARPAPGGGWVLPLPLRGKIREPERAFWTLQGWYRVFGSRPPDAVPLPEAEARERRRQAAWERRGLAALRLVLTSSPSGCGSSGCCCFSWPAQAWRSCWRSRPRRSWGSAFRPSSSPISGSAAGSDRASPPCRRPSRPGSGGNPGSEGPFPAVFCGKCRFVKHIGQ